MNEVLIGATDDVSVGDSQRVDTGTHTLQNMDNFKTIHAPDLQKHHTGLINMYYGFHTS